MATAAPIGGVVTGLQRLMKAGAATSRGNAEGRVALPSFAAQLQVLAKEPNPSSGVALPSPAARLQVLAPESNPSSAGVALPSFAAPPQAMQGGGARPAVAPKAEDRAPGKDAEVVAAGPAKIAAKIAAKSGPEKSGPEKKAPAAESETTNAGARSSAEPAAVTMSLAMSLAMPLPVLPEAFAPAVQGAKGGPGGSIALVGKPAVLRGREAKIAGAGAHAPAAAGKALEGGVPAGAAGVSGAASTGPVAAGPVATGTAAPGGSGGLGGTAAAAPAPVLAAPEVVASGGAGGGKTVESGPRTGMSAGPAMHDEMAGALPASGTALGEPRTLVTTSNVLEVGITGGAHGWLRVRAELEHTGEVTASLVASSAASADALHKELGAMSAYLKSEVVGVSSLAVTAIEKGGAAQGLGSQASAGAGSSAPGPGGGGMQGQGGKGDAKPSLWAGFAEAPSGLGSGYGSQGVPASSMGAGVGGWLNVRV